MKTTTSFLLFALILLLAAQPGYSQETVFKLFKKSSKRADQYYSDGNYTNALALFLHRLKKDSANGDLKLKVARCYYFLKQYQDAVRIYERYSNSNTLLPEDYFYYAEANCSLSNYEHAEKGYRGYLEKQPGDELVLKKIWRISNMRYLYEDSAHYTVRPVSFNTEYGEFGAVRYNNGFLFLSNRREIQPVERLDATSAPFYKIYYTSEIPDTATSADTVRYNNPALFQGITSSSHSGPIALYGQGKKIVFASTGRKPSVSTHRTIQLFYAEETGGRWTGHNPFPYNSNRYSITDPWISEDGFVLFFSSDMEGGFGGKDLYKSVYENGQWSKPVNLGKTINTPYDEVYPFLEGNKTLYFSSNGHAGLGGLDIFKAEVTRDGFDEVENAGYPVNTCHDEFAITLDAQGSHGYFSSNRKNGGFDDDIYEFDIDLQPYPLKINGLVQYKEHNLSKASELKIMANVKLYLLDAIRQTVVGETLSDASGNFYLVIPYFSRYKLKVTEGDNEYIVGLDVPKHKTTIEKYEIVVIRDALKSTSN